jgi:hypothetical protein
MSLALDLANLILLLLPPLAKGCRSLGLTGRWVGSWTTSAMPVVHLQAIHQLLTRVVGRWSASGRAGRRWPGPLLLLPHGIAQSRWTE